MGSRRVWAAVLVVGLLAAVGASIAPVSAEGVGGCGAAGTWFPYLGDPTGLEEPAFVYADDNACGRAATPWHRTTLGGLLLALAGLVGVSRERRQRLAPSVSMRPGEAPAGGARPLRMRGLLGRDAADGLPVSGARPDAADRVRGLRDEGPLIG